MVQDVLPVAVAFVVDLQRSPEPVGDAEVTADGAQVVRRGQGRVVDVVGVRGSVTVRVGAPDVPRRGEELQRTDGPVEGGVPVELAPVGVVDAFDTTLAIQRETPDRNAGTAGLVEPAAGETAVVGFDRPDTGQQRPAQAALRMCG